MKDFGLKDSDFPVLMDIAEEGALNYYISRTMRKSDHIDHLPIYKCEDLFSGMTDRLKKLCKALLKKGKIVEAKGVWERSQLEGMEFDFANHKSDMKDPGAPPQDSFGPVSVDPRCMRLPAEVKVTFVDTEETCLEMREVLLASDFIGMDAEWRPAISRRDKERPALFQIANRHAAFLIDLIALADNPVLDEVLSALFTCEKTVCIGFSFNSDLSMFKRAYKTMKFYQNFAHFCDV